MNARGDVILIIASMLPDGLIYQPGYLTTDEEESLTRQIQGLSFSNFQMRGYIAKRRVTHFGWMYQYDSARVQPGPPPPDFILGLRDRAASLIGRSAEDLAEVLVTEYSPGAGIGWHRDAPMFGEVVGISLLAPCRMRFRRGEVGARETVVLELAPRSVYALTGASRTQWQHSIPPVEALRYSITFRTLRKARR